MSDDIEKWKLMNGISDATNSFPPADSYDRSIWEWNTRQKALSDRSNIPPGHYNGVPINLDIYHPSGSSGPSWSELSDQQRRGALIAAVIAGLFFVGAWIIERKQMQSFGDVFALALVTLLVYAVGYVLIRGLGRLLGFFRKT